MKNSSDKVQMGVKPILMAIMRVGVGVILLIAGISKLLEFGSFLQQIALYDLVPVSLVSKFGYLLVAAELTVGGLLIFGYYTRAAGVIATMLLGMFIIALTSAWLRQLPLDDCGCSNVLLEWLKLSDQPGWSTLLSDIILFLGCLLISTAKSTNYGIEAWIGQKQFGGTKS
jgi:uncharacterized membrane protein YphA (DoxX/SURF4 family)